MGGGGVGGGQGASASGSGLTVQGSTDSNAALWNATLALRDSAVVQVTARSLRNVWALTLIRVNHVSSE